MSGAAATVTGMGEVATIEVADNAALQGAVRDAIESAQATDPLAPVTLIVDSAAQAWALRRQVAETGPRGRGIANLRAMTMTELMSELARRIGIATPSSADPLLQAAVVEALLRSESGALAASADHPDTALRLAALGDELEWCRLGQDVDSLATGSVSLTARAAIRFVADARPALTAALGATPWPDASAAITDALTAGTLSAADLGSVIVACARIPAPVADVLSALAGHAAVTVIRLTPDPAPIAARVLDFPDPATETDFAVRLAAAAIAGKSSPGRVAILYSADSPYARLLERALDDAGIAWHGPTGQTLQSTTVARCLFALTALAAARVDGSSGMTRPLLMRLLALGHLGGGPASVATGPSRALIRQEGLFGDARNWLGHLAAISVAHETDADDLDAVGPRHINRLAPHAEPLAALIRALDAALDSVDSASTWAELGSSLWWALETFHLHGSWWSVRPDDSATVDAVRALLLEGFPAIDALGASAPRPCAADAAEMIDRTLAARRGRHGASSVGIHVGSVASSRGLVFDRVVLVGASEGLLPRSVARTRCSRMPHDAACAKYPTTFPRRANSRKRRRATSARWHAPRAPASRCSREAHCPGGRSGCPAATCRAVNPSAWRRQPRPRAGPPRAGPSGRAHGDRGRDTRRRAASAHCQHRRVGHAGAGAVLRPARSRRDAWSLHDRDLSASGIEQFLHCPYHFFVQRILGFSTDEFEDTVDTIAPNDMGTMLHTAFELFVEESRASGTLRPGRLGRRRPSATCSASSKPRSRRRPSRG